jgi:hypothetical protein
VAESKMARRVRLAGIGGITRYLRVAVQLMTLDAAGSAINAIPTLDPRVKTVATVGVAIGRIQVIRKSLRGLPFGLSALVGGLLSISTITYLMSTLPDLIAQFTGGQSITSGGGGGTGSQTQSAPAQFGTAPFGTTYSYLGTPMVIAGR